MASNEVETAYVEFLKKQYGSIYTHQKKICLDSSNYSWDYNKGCSVMTPSAELRMRERWRTGR